ncbi:MAG: glycosyltransferase, partial [Rhodomicrobium sp.]
NGLPVISARSADTDYLLADGQTGLLTAKDDPAGLASALKALIANRDLARRLSEAGKAQFRENFSEEPVAAKYLDLCRHLKEEYAWRTKPLAPAGDVSARPAFPG